jgi:hypothetical protein
MKKMSNSEDKKDEPKTDVIGDNVALLKSQVITRDKLIEELTAKLADMTDKYTQAKEFVDNDAKKDLLADLVGRVTIPKELLMLKPREELAKMKEILDKAEPRIFKAGTPVSYDKKPSARHELDTMHSKYMAKLMGGN